MSTPTIKHAERIDAKWFAGTNSMHVNAVRIATLEPDLSEIVTCRVAQIEVEWGNADQRQTLALDREQALWLAEALALAVKRTANARADHDRLAAEDAARATGGAA